MFVTKGIEPESSAEGCRQSCALSTFDNGHWTTLCVGSGANKRETEHCVSYVCLGTYVRTYIRVYVYVM
jgi:hypothetical protein